jgi:hypothetical protein
MFLLLLLQFETWIFIPLSMTAIFYGRLFYMFLFFPYNDK